MKWMALNCFGAIFWVTGLYLSLGVTYAGDWDSLFPANAVYVGGTCGLVGLAMLLWANLISA